MPGGKNRNSRGYTIVEIMIVLAVSGVMFLIAATFINGKQEKASFTSGVNSFASQIQDTIEQVVDGRYSDIPLGCTFSGTGVPTFSGAGSQGANPQCVFLGKIIHVDGPIPSSTYKVYSMAGGRLDSSGKPITTLANAFPIFIDSLTTTDAVPQSLNINRVTIDGNTGTPYFTFGFLQSLGEANGGGASVQSGAQTVSLYYDQANDDPNTNPAYDPSSLTTNLTQASSADICVTDGTQYADIVVGTDNSNNSSNPLSVNIVMHSTTKPGTC